MNEELRVIITAEIDKLKKELQNGQKEVNNFTKKSKVSFEEFNGEFQKVGNVAKTSLAVMGGAMLAAGASLLALEASTREYRQEQAKLITAFEAAGGSAAQATQTYNDLYRVLGDEGVATEAAQHLAQLTTNQQHLSEWTTITQGVYATFGASLPIESLTEAANETAKTGALTGALADALNWAGVNEEAFQAKLDACNTEAEREALIRNTLNGLYSEAAAGYEVNAAALLAQNEAQARNTAAMAKLGAAVAPVQTAITNLTAAIAEQLAPIITSFMDEHGEALTAFFEDLAVKIGQVLTWIIDNWELISTIAVVIAGISAALSVVSTVMAVVNAVMAASPITWIILGIVAAIAALVAIIVLCVKHWDEIKAAAGVAWEWIKSKWAAAGEWFGGIVSKIKGVFSGIGSFFSSIFTNAWNGIKSAWSGVTGFFKGIWDSIVGFFKGAIPIPKIKLPRFGISPAGWKIGDLLEGVIPKLAITWHARGGVFDKPTVMHGLGEAGAEAIVPLENNLAWLDKLAGMLNDRMGGNRPIVLQVDGRTFAQISVDSINDLTRHRGSVPLVLA